MKECTICKAIKPIDEFYKDSRKSGRYRASCKSCERASSAKRQKRYKENDPEAYRKQHLKRQKAYNKRQKNNRSESFLKKEVARQRKYKDLRRGIEHDTEYANIVINDICSYCDRPAQSIDHIIPVVNGGNGSSNNLTGACLSCNSSKHSRSLLNYLLYKL